MVNLDGSQCNMVGTGYTAFYAQSVSFYRPKQGFCQTEVLLSRLMHNGHSYRLSQTLSSKKDSAGQIETYLLFYRLRQILCQTSNLMLAPMHVCSLCVSVILWLSHGPL